MASKNTVEIILQARDHASRAVKQAFDNINNSLNRSKGLILGTLGGAGVTGAAGIATAAVGALGASFAAAGVGAAAFGAVATTTLGKVFEAQEEIEKANEKIAQAENAEERAKAMKELQAVYDSMSAKQVEATKALQSFKDSWANFAKEFETPVVDMFIKSLDIMKTLLEPMRPIVQNASDAISELLNSLSANLDSDGVVGFFEYLSNVAYDSITTFGKSFGNIMLGVMNLMVAFDPVAANMEKGFLSLTERFVNWTSSLKDSQGFQTFVNYAKENGPLLFSIIGDVVSVLTRLVGAVAPLGAVLLQGTSAVTGFLSSLLGSKEAGTVFESIRQGAVTAFTAVKGVFTGFLGTVKNLFSGEGNIGESFIRIFNSIKEIALPILTDAIEFIKGIFSELQVFWSENGTQIITAIQNFWSVIAAIFSAVAPVIGFILMSLFENIKGIISGALDIIMGLVKVFTGLFTLDFSMLGQGLLQIFSGALEALWNLWNLIMVGRLVAGIRAFISSGVSLFQQFGAMVRGTFSDFLNNIINLFGYFRATGSSIWSATVDTIKNIISTFVGAARSNFGSIYDDAVRIFGNIKSAIVNPIETAKGAVSRALEGIRSLFSGLSLKLPDIKVPHFRLKNWSANPLDWVKAMPAIDVDWYDKGGVFYGPQIVGVGEKRPEFVGALDDLRKIVREEAGVNQQPQQVAMPQYAVINIDGRQVMLAMIDYIIEEQELRDGRYSSFRGE